MSRQYRAWRDFLVREIEDNMPADQPYHLLHTASMVGLFSCIFVKGSLRNNITDLQVAENKRGLGGFHGNKVGLSEPHLIHSYANLASGSYSAALRTVRQFSLLCQLPFGRWSDTDGPKE